MSSYSYVPAVQYGVQPDVYPPPPPVYMSDPGQHPLTQYADNCANLVRTPSPTPSEIEALNDDGSNWWRKYLDPGYWKDWKHILQGLVIVLLVGFIIAFYIFNDQIVNALQPAINWMKNLHLGWLIPIGIFIVISFPPILAILCGLVWGIGIGFAIVAAGGLLGEIANFFTFKYSCKARSAKLEATSIFYASLSQIVKQGGLKIALIVRYSAVPSHFTTVVFATCGMSFTTFIIAAVLSLPKMLVHVFIGVSLSASNAGNDSKRLRILNIVVVIAFVIITIVAMKYIKKRLAEVTPAVVYARRKARQIKETTSLSSV
ncbi:hypothetical protein JAAARDRAFT_72915 [Jaapia argillacea MUCL 33604]|uniref:Golgi apparatus membrane protein TVP38 n=1 Tax=Jaapia argillacea MUCL 33604 TaxID=933084 RepID=A0A067PFN9_9AGAM|nr:hypothetical protein JAAARDRAFT_72915 [Jaapia argillacea MUCL 33604]